jgi:fatty acid synthase subunit alpha
MPGGLNITSIKAQTWGLGPSRSDGVLPLGTTWLDIAVAAYAQRSGIPSQLEGLEVVA